MLLITSIFVNHTALYIPKVGFMLHLPQNMSCHFSLKAEMSTQCMTQLLYMFLGNH